MFFFDTSALVKPYLGEHGADAVLELTARLRGQVYISSHVALEAFATFAYKFRDRRLTPDEYRRARRAFREHYQGSLRILQVDDKTVEVAVELADRHRRIGVGAVDLLHVATAMQLKAPGAHPPTIVCADRAMRNLASATGFRVFNPETDDLATLTTDG